MTRVHRAHTAAAPRSGAGFTLLEMMFTITILSILLALAVPSYQDIMASRQAGSAAQSLAAALRQAQAEAPRLNRNIEVLMTAADPAPANTVSAAPTTPSGAVGWLVRRQGATTAADFVAGEPSERFGQGISTGGTLRSVTFTPLGRVLDTSGAIPVLLASPLIVQFNHVALNNRYCTYVTPGGSIRVCDSGATPGSNSACAPRLPTGC